MSTSVLLATSVQRSIALVVAWLTIVAFAVYLFVNIRKAKPELGNETDLAPNRKPYYDDETLEGPRLDRFLTGALVLLGIVALGLPLYWLAEPGRQADTVKRFEAIFAKRGETLYNTNCSSCHGQGGGGGVAAFVLQGKQGEFLANVTWNAPELSTTLLRFNREEVKYVLDHGRAYSPMQPWSTVGGGAMNDQQIKNLIDYMDAIKLTPEEAQAELRQGLVARIIEERQVGVTDDAERTSIADEVNLAFEENDSDLAALIALGEAGSENEAKIRLGELVFNSEIGAGGYSCARCHTPGWSYGRPGATGAGAFGPKLWGVIEKFNDVDQLQQFLAEGCDLGKLYGRQSQCKSGMMPGFGQMYTTEQLASVAAYVAALDGTQQFYPDGTPRGAQ